MSLINKMLRDLDARRAPAADRPILPGAVHTAHRRRRETNWVPIALGAVAGGAIAGGAWYWLSASSVPASAPVPAAVVQAQPPAAPAVSQPAVPPVVAAMPAPATVPTAPAPAAAPAAPAPAVPTAAPAASAPTGVPAPAAPAATPAVKPQVAAAQPALATPTLVAAAPAPASPPVRQSAAAASAKAMPMPPTPATAAANTAMAKPPTAAPKAAPLQQAGGKKAPAAPGSIEKRPVGAPANEAAENKYNEAVAALRRGADAEAIADLQAALRLDAAHVSARQALLALLVRSQRFAEAQTVAAEGLAAVPSQAGWALALARLQLGSGKLAEASETLARHARYAERDADYQAVSAVLMQKQKRFQEAVDLYRAALALRGSESRWWYGLGVSLENVQQPQEARAAFVRAREIGNLPPELVAGVERRLR